MSKATEKAQEILDALAPILPLKVNEVTDPDANPILATIRKNDGYPALLPHPESQSILSGSREIFTFIEKGPVVLKALLEEIESNNRPSSAKPAV